MPSLTSMRAARTHQDRFEVHLGQRPVMSSELPESLLRYVIRTQKITIPDDASTENLFSEDEYVRRSRPRSVFCLPFVKQAKLMGVLYLENNLPPRVFTPERLAVLERLASQAAISLDNARPYAELTQENNDRKKPSRHCAATADGRISLQATSLHAPALIRAAVQ
jgi:GAF domain-containing protein